MAAKDGQPDRIISETADLWFHCLVALTHYNLRPEDVLAELARREDCPASRKRPGGRELSTEPDMSDNCIFCKIARGEIPAKKVFEDDEFVAFHDINPAAPVHLLLIPRRHVIVAAGLIAEGDAGWFGRMICTGVAPGGRNGCNPGYRGVSPDGQFGAEGGQSTASAFPYSGWSRPWKGRVAPRRIISENRHR